MTAPCASIPLDRFDRPGAWRQTKKALCHWQATGQAFLAIGGQPVDIVSVARATGPDDLPRPAGCPPDRLFVIVVFDPKLAHGLIRLAADAARRDGPPPDDPPPIGSEP